MDPNETLRIMRSFSERILKANDTTEWTAASAHILADHIDALDVWLSNGGTLPTAWQR